MDLDIYSYSHLTTISTDKSVTFVTYCATQTLALIFNVL